MTAARPILALSPYHTIELAEPLVPMLERPSRKDYVIRTVSQKLVNGMPLIQGDLVISGLDTLDRFPLASRFPVHFRKTHFPICLHADPDHEFHNLLRASQIIRTPPPIGADRSTFRSCFIPGKPLSRLTPFTVEPQQNNVNVGERSELATLIGVWSLLEKTHVQVKELHRNGLYHNDLFLHNIIVSLAPLDVFLIDFEKARSIDPNDTGGNDHGSRLNDFDEVFRQAIYLQCLLGEQPTPLGVESRDRISDLFDNPDYFTRRMRDQQRVAHTTTHA